MLKALIVDDNKSTLVLYTEILKSRNISIIGEALDGTEAIEIIYKYINDIDIIILDYIMPKMDGVEVLKYIEDIISQYSIIFITANPNIFPVLRSRFNLKYLIEKPFELNQLFQILDEIKERVRVDKLIPQTH